MTDPDKRQRLAFSLYQMRDFLSVVGRRIDEVWILSSCDGNAMHAVDGIWLNPLNLLAQFVEMLGEEDAAKVKWRCFGINHRYWEAKRGRERFIIEVMAPADMSYPSGTKGSDELGSTSAYARKGESPS